MQYMTTALIVAGMLALAGCAHITPRGGTPAHVWQARSSLDDASNCVVAALNREMVGGALNPAVTHSIQTIEMKNVHEVVPQQNLMLAGEIYFVRLTAAGPAVTRIELFSNATWTRRLANAVSRCSSS